MKSKSKFIVEMDCEALDNLTDRQMNGEAEESDDE